MKVYRIRLFVILFIALAFQSAWGIYPKAQSEIVLTVSFVTGMEYLEDSQIFDQFEQEHPNVQIHVIYPDITDLLIPSANFSLIEHLQGNDDYTRSADILIASIGESLPPEVSLEATRAGYYLDLNPLLQADTNFDASVYYPSVWQSALWDGGAWLLPLSTQLYTVIYNPEAFDNAGLAYPNANWTLPDYVNAINALTPRNAEGTATAPGYIGFNRSDHALIYSLFGFGVADTSTIPILPHFDHPDLVSFAEQWTPLYASGAIYSPTYVYSEDFSPASIPLTTDRIQSVAFSEDDASATLFSGGRAGLSVSGLAVSSRTEHPEEAYALARYLADDIRVADALVTTFSFISRARPSYSEVDALENAPYSINRLSQEDEALVETALQNAIPASELHFFGNFVGALSQVGEMDTDVRAVLQNAEVVTRENIETASAQRTLLEGVIPTPEPTASLISGEISLRFWINSYAQYPNQENWANVIENFVEDDPQVGEIILDNRQLNIERISQEVDCFYLPYNAISTLPFDSLINFDPILSADPTFDPDDFIANTLAQVQQNNQIWAYPMDIQPTVIWVNTNNLAQSRLQPNAIQTIDEFIDLLNALDINQEDEPSLVSSQPGSTLLMLIAANGGLPVDFRTTPPQLNFTDNLLYIREILDLARAGKIFYEPLSTWDNLIRPIRPSLYVDTLSTRNFNTEGYQPIFLPQDTSFTPISYDLGTAYITRHANNPEACYRLITTLSQRPELFLGLPARPSIAHTTLMQNADMAFYQSLDTILDSANTIAFPRLIGTNATSDFIVTYWLYRAFDRYVLEDVDLEAQLTEAEQFTHDYLICIEDITFDDLLTTSRRDYNRQLVECAVQVDLTSADYFNFGR